MRRQVAVPIVCDGEKLEAGFRIDLLVAEAVVLEIKSLDTLTRVHEAQLMTYLKPSGIRIGFLIKFNVELFKNGLRRFAL